jgi:WD40 repeat protein
MIDANGGLGTINLAEENARAACFARNGAVHSARQRHPAEVAMQITLLAATVVFVDAIAAFAADDQTEPVLTLTGHTGRVTAVAWSPNGAFIATGGQDRTVRLWRAETGELLHTLEGHEDQVFSLAFRPDGYLLASASACVAGGEVRIWTVNSGRPFRRYEYSSRVNRVAYGPHNAFAVACADGSVDHRYACTGKTLATLRPTELSLQFVGFRPDESLIAATGGHHPTLWNAPAGTQLAACHEHTFAASRLALSPDGRTLAAAGVSELKLWDVETGALKSALRGIHGQTSGIAFTPDGRTLVTGGNNCHAREGDGQQRVELFAWDVERGVQTGRFPGDLPLIWSLAVAPDGARVATGGPNGTVTVYDAAAPQPVSNPSD